MGGSAPFEVGIQEHHYCQLLTKNLRLIEIMILPELGMN